MTDFELITRHFLGIYFLFIGLHYTCTILGLRRRTGASHIRYGVPGSATWWYRQTFNLFRAAILGVCLVRIAWPGLDQWLGIFTALYQPPVLAAGIFTLLASYGIVGYVHAYMHEDWRSGIDPTKRRPLLTEGPFARSRNPLFLGIMLGQLGLFLALPSLFTLLCLIAGVTVIVLQTQREEKTLEEVYGEEYAAYRQRVPRWW